MDEEKKTTRKDLPVHSQNCTYDDELEHLCRIAAWIGRQNHDPTPVTFGSLLSAFFLAKDSVSRWFQKYAESAKVNSAAIAAHGPRSEEGYKELILENLASEEVPVSEAEDEAYYSRSVLSLLEKARESHRILTGNNVLGTRDVMAVYAFDGEAIHSDDIKTFKLDTRNWQARFVLPNPSDISRDTTSVVRRILLRTKQLRSLRKDAQNDLTSRVLLYATLEQGNENRKGPDDSLYCRALRKAVNGDVPDKAESLFSGYFEKTPGDHGTLTGGIETMSTNAARLLYAANAYGRSYFESRDRIDETGLISALLLDVSAHITEFFKKVDIQTKDLQHAFLAEIQKNDADAAVTWSNLFAGKPPPERTEWVSGFTADNPFDKEIHDALGVENEAQSFARIASAKTVIPPLAIGVFGEWGSGKTFFMNRMMKNIKKLAEDARKGFQADLFHDQIVQIRFNAWHYIETNLWASLVDYIFHELDLWLHDQEKDLTKVNSLFESLSTARHLKLESVREVIRTRREENRAIQALEEAQKEYGEAYQEKVALTPEMIRKAAVSAFQESLQPEDRKKIRDAADKLGLTSLGESAVEARELVEQVHEQTIRGRVLLRSMLATLGKAQTFVLLFLLLVVLPGLVLFLTKWLPAEWAAWIRTTTGSLSYYLVVIAGVAAKVVHATSQGLNTLQSFNDRLQQKIRQAQIPETTIEKAELELQKKRAEVQKAEKHLNETQQQVEEARRDWVDNTARGRLNRFIRDKVVGGDYAKHLGIIAAIRKDFGQLAQIMAEDVADEETWQAEEQTRKEYESEVHLLIKEAGSHLKPGEKKKLTKSAEIQQIPKSFQRIILYIDDLDRCPPEKVVEVLQAIHLLLCFPLFVVVVAVDARWVSRALNHEFPELLEENVMIQTNSANSGVTVAGDGNLRARLRGATSQDYLEKIFQIPYWVLPMDDEAAKRYVRRLVEKDQQDYKKGQLKGETQDVQENLEHVVSDSSEQTKPEITSEMKRQEKLKKESEENQENELRRDNNRQRGGQEHREEEQYTPEHVVKSMHITKHEQLMLENMAPFTGRSPRRGLRFVNLYRLVKTSLKLHQLDSLVGDDGKQLGYRALIAQLAITTGSPRIAQYYFNKIKGEEELPKTLTELVENLENDKRLTDSQEEWNNLKGAIKTLEAENEKDKVSTDSLMLQELYNYAPIVRRYSFTARQS